jgi:hypothetical protein
VPLRLGAGREPGRVAKGRQGALRGGSGRLAAGAKALARVTNGYDRLN